MKNFCSQPGCNKLVDKAGPCSACSTTSETIRRQSIEHQRAKKFYDSSQWKRLRRYQLDKEPLCRSCKANGITTEARHVDHIKPRSDSRELELSVDNLQSLCVSCHAKKTNRERISSN